MDTDRKWVVVRIDGKIAAISTDYRMLASISSRLADRTTFQGDGNDKSAGAEDKGRSRRKTAAGKSGLYGEITAVTVGMDEIWKLRQEAKWEDLMLFGTDFQKKVWRKLWELTHPSGHDGAAPIEEHVGLICYSDFAELCENRAGVRAVAHAVGLNPISVIIPCHLVIPKESIDRIREIRKKAEATIFKGDDLCIKSIIMDQGIDFGNYALGRELKRQLISIELAPFI